MLEIRPLSVVENCIDGREVRRVRIEPSVDVLLF